MPISGEVAIIGTGYTKFGENLQWDYKDMLIDACYEAYADAGIDPGQIQAAWLGAYLPYNWGYEGVAGSTLADTLALSPIPVVRLSNYCASGQESVRAAAYAVACGEFDVVLAAGAEKMRDLPSRGSLVAQHVERGHPLYCKGRTAPGMFALLATRYLRQNKLDEEILAKVAVKNHKNGSMNPKAHFQREINVEMARKAPPVAEPLRLFDCCPTTDGAAAAILCRKELAPKFNKDYLVIKGCATATHGGYFTLQFEPDFDFLGFKSTQEAAKAAYQAAGIKDPAKEVHVADVHDCFTITEMLNYEDLGFAPRGEGWRMIEEGESSLEGRLPVNPSGGLKSFGHPIGASGIRMIAEVCDQVRGRCGKRQVKKAEVGVAHTLGGPGVVACVTVVGRP